MGRDSGDWEEEGVEDISLAERIDPLLDLITDLAICYQALSESRGLICAACDCRLSYHIPCDNGECEFCGCYEIRRICCGCGIARALESFLVGNRVCKFCEEHPPIRIMHPIKSERRESITGSTKPINGWDRAKAARMVLRELTE